MSDEKIVEEMSNLELNQRLGAIDKQADRYYRTYRPYMDLLETKSTVSRVRPVKTYDFYALGKQLESFEVYRKLCEDEGTLTQLGKIPDMAFDIITVNYGTSPISSIASIQPISEELGTVYYKNVWTQSQRGNVTANQLLYGPDRAEEVDPIGFAGDTLTISIGNTVGAQASYSFAGSGVYGPIRPGTASISVPHYGLIAKDDMNGHLVGYHLQADITYATGAIANLKFTGDAPDGAYPMTLTYATDYEASGNIPQIQFKLDTKSVRAKVFALKSTIGLEMAYSLQMRFGAVAEDEIASDLVAAINSEIMNSLVALLLANAVGNTNWSKTPDASVSYFDHKMTFKDTIADAESEMLKNAGRGTINVMIGGRNVCALLSTLPGFVKISDGTSIGPHIFGTLDGVTIVRIPNAALLPANVILGLYNSGNPFEAPAVYAPYMPLVVTTALPTGSNPLLNQKAAAIWAATDILLSRFITKITITNMATS